MASNEGQTGICAPKSNPILYRSSVSVRSHHRSSVLSSKDADDLGIVLALLDELSMSEGAAIALRCRVLLLSPLLLLLCTTGAVLQDH